MKIFLSSWFLIFSSLASAVTFRAIYNGDDRQDIHQVEDRRVHALADSSLALFDKKNLTRRGDVYDLDTTPMTEALELCEDEKFAKQPAAAECSAVLIGPDLVLTAGHCIGKKTCSNTAFAFGYSTAETGEVPTSLSASEVFFCKKIVEHSATEELDYAVVKLNRRVENHIPVRLAHQRITPGEKVFLLGHPGGTPLKYAQPAKVRSSSATFFTSELDAIGGNSGGGVYSSTSFELVGILVAGEEDYVYDKKNKCYRMKHCHQDECIGEDSTHLDKIKFDISLLEI